MIERFLRIDCKGEALPAILHEPAGPSRNVAILIIVGGPQYRVGSHRQFVLMARRLAEAGYSVLRFDYRGMGDSTGSPRTFADVDDDIGAAVHVLRALPNAASKVVLFGLCDAASAAMMYCATDATINGLILVNPWVRTEAGAAKAHVRHYYAARLLQRSFWSKALTGKVEMLASLRNFVATLKRSLDRRQPPIEADPGDFLARMASGLGSFKESVLLVMSGRDLTAREFDGLCSASRQWSTLVARPGISRVDLPEADHTFSTTGALEDASREILHWLRQNCDETHDVRPDSALGGRPIS